jgi:hypothetical protein
VAALIQDEASRARHGRLSGGLPQGAPKRTTGAPMAMVCHPVAVSAHRPATNAGL